MEVTAALFSHCGEQQPISHNKVIKQVYVHLTCADIPVLGPVTTNRVYRSLFLLVYLPTRNSKSERQTCSSPLAQKDFRNL